VTRARGAIAVEGATGARERHGDNVLVAALLLTIAGCTSGDAPAAAPAGGTPPAPVRVVVLSPEPLDRSEEAVGVVSTLDSVEIRPETSGLVASVHFADGERVRKGQVLVRLRDADAQAGLADATARAKLAALALDRARALFARGDVAQADLDRAEADDGLARAAVAKAEEALRRTTLAAPFDGVAGRRDVSPGQTVDPTRVLTRVEALDRLAVDVSLPEPALARVAVGQPASVWVEAMDLRVPGLVGYIAPRVRDESRTVDVRVSIPTPDPRLRPGLSATVRIVTAQVAEALQVPTEALVPSGAGMSVWVVAGDTTVSLKPVRTGVRSPDRVEVVEGLAAGDQVVVEGLSRLRPGAKVAVGP